MRLETSEWEWGESEMERREAPATASPLKERRLWLFLGVVELAWLVGLGYALSLIG